MLGAWVHDFGYTITIQEVQSRRPEVHEKTSVSSIMRIQYISKGAVCSFKEAMVLITDLNDRESREHLPMHEFPAKTEITDIWSGQNQVIRKHVMIPLAKLNIDAKELTRLTQFGKEIYGDIKRKSSGHKLRVKPRLSSGRFHTKFYQQCEEVYRHLRKTLPGHFKSFDDFLKTMSYTDIMAIIQHHEEEKKSGLI
jgi:hypothetical protein